MADQGHRRLTAVAGQDSGRAWDLAGRTVIGRDPDAEIFISDTEASRRHALLTDERGAMFIEDLGSTNGTWLNGERIQGRRPLADADEVQIGMTRFRLQPLTARESPSQVSRIARPPAVSPAGPVQQVPPAFSPLPLFGPRMVDGRPSSISAEPGKPGWTLLVVCLGTFMLLLDTTVVTVALPEIQSSLGADFSDLQWVVNAYALTLAVFLLTAGALADRFGRRLVFLVGMVIFSVASLACGLVPDALFLNLMRGLQGVGAAAMFATSLALIAGAFRGPGRAAAFGIWGATTGVAVAVGPLAGGAITKSLGWEWIFFVNLPLCVIALAIALIRVRESRNPRAGGVDWPGLIAFCGAIFLLLLALIQGNERGWTSTTILAMLGASAALFVAFVLVELRRRQPMLDLHLFRNPAFNGISIAAFALSATMFAMLLYITLYLQTVLGYDALEAGLRLLPLMLLSLAVAPIAGALTGKIPTGGLLGLGLFFVGVGLLTMHGLTPDSDWTTLLLGFIVAGAGIGMINPPLATAAVAVAPPERSGMASGANATFRELGLATGIAALGAIFQSRVEEQVTERVTGTPGLADDRVGELAEAVATGNAQEAIESAPPPVRPTLAEAFGDAFTGALDDILLVGAVVALVGGTLVLLLVRERNLSASAEGDMPPEPGTGRPAGDALASA
jgi:EmrB/QacA subfamily drug resistance transporter